MPVDAVPRLGAARSGDLGAALHDGYEIHAAALRRGLDVMLYPRQVLTAGSRPQDGELSFVHGIPGSSTQSGVTYAQDKQMRRELQAAAGLPVPAGAGFAIGRELYEAKRFAARIGYPVVVKPRLGDNMVEVLPGLRNEHELTAAIDYLRTAPVRRPHFTRASYAITLLSEPIEEAGQTFVPAGYRFLVERHISGHYLRFLVLHDRVVSAVHAPAGLGYSNRICDVTNQTHPTVSQLAVDAARAVPGLALAAVDIVLADHRKPVTEQRPVIVEFSERPWLEMQRRVSVALSRHLADTILSEYAAGMGVALGPPRIGADVRFRIHGAADATGAATAIAAAADRCLLIARIERADRVAGAVSGTLAGSVDDVACIFELLVAGRLDGQRAMFVSEQCS
jgi:D-alanine-D-alanine ligase-like ATP-grasp enzyme